MQKTERALWGAVGGFLPVAIQLIRQGFANPAAPIPAFGTFYILACLLCVLLGVIASMAFESHNILAALYHGATAPVALAFLINPHSPLPM